MNTPIEFKLAKLLNSKGLPGIGPFYENKTHYDFNPKKYTIADVVMWLHEKHGIWIVIIPELLNGTEIRYYPSIFEQGVGDDIEEYFDSPTAAYSAAILHTLTKLI